MRKFYLIILVMTGFIACTNDGLREGAVQEDTPLTQQYDPNRRSFAEAVEIAQNSIKMLDEDKAVTRGVAPVRKLNLKDGVKAFHKVGTRSGEASSDNDTLIYVFNFEDNQGFSIVSASRHAEGLIAVVEEGSYDPDVPTGNPGFDTYMNMAKAYVAYKDKKEAESVQSSTRGVTVNPMYKPVYDTIYYQNIAPKISVKWGQGYRMGQYCPNGLSGCCNTAAAQIMSYYKYPTIFPLSYPGCGDPSITINWTAMCNRIYSTHTYNYDSVDEHIGKLARQLGFLSNSTYDSGGTGTTDSNIRSALMALGYNAGSLTTYNYSNTDAGYSLANLLAANKLIYMGGYNSDGKGHAWVIDGCKYVKALHRMMVSYDGGITWTIFQELGTYRTCHNHINWGWNGAGNGYFYSWIVDAYNEIQYDDPTNSLPSGYNLNYYNNIQYCEIWH